MNCDILKIVRGNDFATQMTITALDAGGNVIEDFSLEDSTDVVVKYTLAGESHTIEAYDYDIEGNDITIQWSDLALGKYGFEIEGKFNGYSWRSAARFIFQIVADNASANIPDGVLVNGIYILNDWLRLLSGTGGGIKQVQADWTETDTEAPSYIQHKPELAPVATSGSYNDLTNKPTIPDVSGKADKVSGAVSGDFAALDANGNLTDSGKKASDFATAAQGAKADTAIQDISGKQDVLVSGTNIKTINNESILGSGNITIEGGGGDVESVNGKTGVVVLDATDVGALPDDTPIPEALTTVNVSVDGNVGTPSGSATISSNTISFEFNNLKGQQGTQGKSAYQIWLDEGHSGTEADFLASLQGNTGSSVSYPFTLVNNLIEGGTDKALTAEQGKVLNGLLSIQEQFSPTWLQGGLDTQNKYISTNNARICCAIPYTGDLIVTVASGYYVSVHSYIVEYASPEQITSGDYWLGNISDNWQEGTFSVSQPTRGKTYVLIVKKGSAGTTTVSPTEGATAVSSTGYETFKPAIKQMQDTLYGYIGDTYEQIEGTWRQGTLDYLHKYILNNLQNQRIIAAFPCNTDLKINIASGYYASLHMYSTVYTDIIQDTSGNGFISTPGVWYEGEQTFTNDGTIKTFVIILKKGSAGTDDISASEGYSAIEVYKQKEARGLVQKVDELMEGTGNSVIGSDFIRKNIKVEGVGTLQYLQSFCIYNGKYYSTDGSNIAEQDATFNVLRDVSINLEHGNSLQLGSNGIAWASGWDDQKVYKVNLSTLSVVDTITLPTTGYTTVAVDDLNGFMYIFQRDSYPSTQTNYNFIVYDYVNNEIISSKVIESFAAMQSVDFYRGKIIMLYGLGTIAAPSGMRVYDTNGNVLAEYFISAFSSKEPEGVCFDRDNLELIVSDVDKTLYKIS